MMLSVVALLMLTNGGVNKILRKKGLLPIEAYSHFRT